MVIRKKEQVDIVKKLLKIESNEDVNFLLLWSEKDLNILIALIKVKLESLIYVCPGGPYMV